MLLNSAWSAESLDIGQHLPGVRGEIGMVGQVIRLRDLTARVDEVAHPAGQPVLEVRLTLFAHRVVQGTDRLVRIGQQAVGKALAVGEGLLVVDAVERRAEDGRVGGLEFWGSITEPATLQRSARGGGFGVPPQRHPLTGEIRQRHVVARLVGEGEARCLCSHIEHLESPCVVRQQP